MVKKSKMETDEAVWTKIFFVGTEAEFIKVFSVIMNCMEKGGICHIIASSQDDLTKAEL